MPMRNTTDYEFPPNWGQMSDEEKHLWFCERRHYRQWKRLDDNWERDAPDVSDADEYRVDDDLK